MSSTPPSADLCRVSGYLTDPLGRPLKKFKIRIYSKDAPIVTPNQMVIGETMDVASDDSGYVQFDLYKGAEVDIILGNRAEQRRPVVAPDASTIDLLDLIFPYVASVQLALEETSLEAGDSTVATVTGTLSDTRTLDVTGFSTLSSSSEAVATVSGSGVTAVAAGDSTISVTEVDTTSLYTSPPDGFLEAFQDRRERVFVRKDHATVDLGNAVAVTVT